MTRHPRPELCREDSKYRFHILDLPPELRLRNLDFALKVDTDKYMCTTDGKLVKIPPLLQTCHSIRKLGMPLYHRLNRFTLDIIEPEYRSTSFYPKGSRVPHRDELKPSNRQWLVSMGPINIANIRYVNIRYWDCRLDIDLCAIDCSVWRKHYDPQHDYKGKHAFPCSPPPRQFLTFAEFYSDDSDYPFFHDELSKILDEQAT